MDKVPDLSTIYLYLSQSCNMRCGHCWLNPDFAEDGKVRKEDIRLKDLLPAIDRARLIGLKRVKITGGEPFIHREILDLLSALKERGLGIIIETNGTLIGREEADAIKDCGVGQVAVSLDGPDAETHEAMRGVKGSFKDALRGVKYLKERSLNIQIIASLWRGNMDNMAEMPGFARGLGANSLKINIVNTVGRGSVLGKEDRVLSVREMIEYHRGFEEKTRDLDFRVIFDIPPAFKSLRSIRKQISGVCGIHNILGILGDGKISICGIGAQVGELVMGDIYRDDIIEVWKNDQILGVIRKDIPDKLQGVCGICIFKRRCKGKCRAEAYYSTASLFAPFSFCQTAYEEGLFPSTRILETALSRS